jgi:hypothetical protein
MSSASNHNSPLILLLLIGLLSWGTVSFQNRFQSGVLKGVMAHLANPDTSTQEYLTEFNKFVSTISSVPFEVATVEESITAMNSDRLLNQVTLTNDQNKEELTDFCSSIVDEMFTINKNLSEIKEKIMLSSDKYFKNSLLIQLKQHKQSKDSQKIFTNDHSQIIITLYNKIEARPSDNLSMKEYLELEDITNWISDISKDLTSSSSAIFGTFSENIQLLINPSETFHSVLYSFLNKVKTITAPVMFETSENITKRIDQIIRGWINPTSKSFSIKAFSLDQKLFSLFSEISQDVFELIRNKQIKEVSETLSESFADKVSIQEFTVSRIISLIKETSEYKESPHSLFSLLQEYARTKVPHLYYEKIIPSIHASFVKLMNEPKQINGKAISQKLMNVLSLIPATDLNHDQVTFLIDNFGVYVNLGRETFSKIAIISRYMSNNYLLDFKDNLDLFEYVYDSVIRVAEDIKDIMITEEIFKERFAIIHSKYQYHSESETSFSKIFTFVHLLYLDLSKRNSNMALNMGAIGVNIKDCPSEDMFNLLKKELSHPNYSNLNSFANSMYFDGRVERYQDLLVKLSETANSEKSITSSTSSESHVKCLAFPISVIDNKDLPAKTARFLIDSWLAQTNGYKKPQMLII